MHVWLCLCLQAGWLRGALSQTVFSQCFLNEIVFRPLLLSGGDMYVFMEGGIVEEQMPACESSFAASSQKCSFLKWRDVTVETFK